MTATTKVLAKALKDIPEGMEKKHFESLEDWADYVVERLDKENNKKLNQYFVKYGIHVHEYIENKYPDQYPPIKKKIDDKIRKQQQKIEKAKAVRNDSDIIKRLDQLRSEKGGPLSVGFFTHDGGSFKDQAEYKLLESEGLDYIAHDTRKGTDTYSRDKMDFLKGIQTGDTIIVFQLSHLVKSIPHLIMIIEDLCNKEIHIKSLSEPWLDTTNSEGFTTEVVFRGLSELTKEFRMEKRDESIQKAKDNGQKFGRSLKSNANVDRAIEMYKNNINNYTMTKICEINNISRSTLWRKLRDLDLL